MWWFKNFGIQETELEDALLRSLASVATLRLSEPVCWEDGLSLVRLLYQDSGGV